MKKTRKARQADGTVIAHQTGTNITIALAVLMVFLLAYKSYAYFRLSATDQGKIAACYMLGAGTFVVLMAILTLTVGDGTSKVAVVTLFATGVFTCVAMQLWLAGVIAMLCAATGIAVLVSNRRDLRRKRQLGSRIAGMHGCIAAPKTAQQPVKTD